MQKIHKRSTHTEINLQLITSGSVNEDTKIGLPDEFDCQIILADLEGRVEVRSENDNGLVVGFKKVETEAAAQMGDIVGTGERTGEILPGELYSYLYTLICEALSDRDTFKDLPLCMKNINKEQIHLEWRGDHFLMMALKIDVVFGVKIDTWYPKKGRFASPLLTQACSEYGMHLLVRGFSWRPSFSRIEGEIMTNLPLVVKRAYRMAKIINNFLEYDKNQLPYRVKSYDLKNAVMYEMDAYCSQQGSTLASCFTNTGHSEVKLADLHHNIDYEEFLQKACEWTYRICDQGLKRLLREGDGKPYYFGLGYTRMTQAAGTRLLRYADVVIGSWVHTEEGI